MKLQNTTALIPGASRPIGRHIARKFLKEGANLVLPWFDWPESVAEMENEFSSESGRIVSCECDLRDIEQVRDLIDKSSKCFDSLDYIINNIDRGGMPIVHGSYDHEHNSAQWELEFETTVKAKWNIVHCASKLLHASEGGAIVNLSSIAGQVGRSGPAACFFSDGYSAASSAVRSLTESWAREYAPKIRVNEIVFGLVHTRHGMQTRGWATLSESERQKLVDHTLLNRLADPSELADLVYYFAVEASYVTGAVIRMDGGYTLGGEHVPQIPPGIL